MIAFAAVNNALSINDAVSTPQRRHGWYDSLAQLYNEIRRLEQAGYTIAITGLACR